MYIEDTIFLLVIPASGGNCCELFAYKKASNSFENLKHTKMAFSGIY